MKSFSRRPTGLCPSCAQLRRIPDHSSTLQRTTPSEASCSTSNSYAHLHDLGNRTENPGVGGSIPSLPTMFFAYFRTEMMRSSSATGRVTGRVGVVPPVAPVTRRE